MLSSIFHTHFYENGYSTVFLDYKFCFFSSETCCDFQGDLYKAIKRKAGVTLTWEQGNEEAKSFLNLDFY